MTYNKSSKCGLKNQSVFQNRNLPIETVRSSDDRVDTKKKQEIRE